MAHGCCRPGAAACACNGGGSQSRCILRGADAIASLRRFADTSTDADRFTACACPRRDSAAERSAAAATPFAFGLPGAYARLRSRMAEGEGNGPGSRQDLVRIRPGLSCKVNLRRFGPSEHQPAEIFRAAGWPTAPPIGIERLKAAAGGRFQAVRSDPERKRSGFSPTDAESVARRRSRFPAKPEIADLGFQAFDLEP